MTKNIGKTDKTIRIIAAVIISSTYITGMIPNPFGFILLSIGGILLVTAMVDFCPLYSIFKISSSKPEKED